MARKKLSAIEKAYNKEVRNLAKRIKRAEEKGYIYLVDPTPARPKKIKPESIEKLKRIRGEKLTRKASAYTSPFSGEILSPKSKQAEREAKELERQKREALKLARQGKDISDYAESVQSYVYGKINKPIQEPPEELPKEPTEEEPGVDPGIVGAIADGIKELPDVKWFGYKNQADYSTYKDFLLGTLYDNAEGQGTMSADEYIKYLYEKADEIFTHIELIKYSSDQSVVEGSFSALARLIKAQDLTHNELEIVESMYDYYDDYEV